MLHLKSLTIHRFKSFRHAELLLNDGFTCIVGRNGSGKSTIFDALTFGLGVTSRKRLRVNSMKDLLSDSLKSKKGLHTAYVKLAFTGDESIEVTRYIRSDGKHAYRVNGRRMKKGDVMELLAKHGIKSDYTNTMLQGEINRAIDMNPKERRELIDIASGIKEFDIKKDESLKELDKVDQKISEARVSLNERSGFLKELGKEKEVAESYLNFSKRLKVLRYSLLVMKNDALQMAYDDAGRKMAVAEQKRAVLRQKYDGMSLKIEKLNSERQTLISEMNERTSSSGERSKRLEISAAELAKVKAELSNREAQINQSGMDIASLEAERKGIEERISANADEISHLKDEEKIYSRIVSDLDYLGVADEKADEIRLINQRILELSSRLIEEQEHISRVGADRSAILDRKDFYKKQAEELSKSTVALVSEMNTLGKREPEIDARLKKIAEELERLGAETKSLSSKIENADEKLIELREQRSYARQKNSQLESRLASAFKEKDGFYGKAASLCTYELEHSAAIEAAAGARMEYFVVEDIDSANRIIEYIKRNGLGRATFIPLKEIKTVPQREEDGMEMLVGLVKFDKRFGRAFEFIFEDTFLAQDISQIKKKGIGKHRYVTVEGELVERSGIISGGSGYGKISVRTIDMTIEKFDSEKKISRELLDSVSNAAFELRKEKMLLEGELKSIKERSARLSSEIAIDEKKLNEAVSGNKEIDAKAAEMDKQLAEMDRAKLDTAMEIDRLKAKLEDAEKGKKGKGAMVEERRKLNEARASMDKARIKTAELSKESEMAGKRASDIDSSVKKIRLGTERSKKEMKELLSKREELEESRKKIEEEIKNSSSVTSKAYERIKKMEEELQSMGIDNGKTSAELSGAERELNELNIVRSQTETRLSDIKAELSSYEDKAEVVKGKIEDMEAEANLLNLRIKELGNVNLKAPEIYGIKKAEVDEADAKVLTLEAEKEAVLNMINEIESKKLQVFMDTFNEISKNFTKLHRYVFAGKDASLKLSDPSDPLESGLDISIKEEGSSRSVMQLSGGEKSIAVLVLLFSIYTYRPSRIYIFDEVDSALDKDNSRLLSKLIKDMSKEAQFVVVSHNDSLVVDADAAIGVIKESAESNVVGVEIAELAKNR